LPLAGEPPANWPHLKNKHMSLMNIILFLIRIVIIVIVSALFISAFTFVCLGIYAEFNQISKLFTGDHDVRAKAMLSLLEVVDLFLIALVLFILGIGLAQLFLGEHLANHSEKFSWLHFHNFTELKLLIWKMILTTMLVSFFVLVYQERDHLEWKILIFPVSILLISVSLYVIKADKKLPPKPSS
jgi:uncharacterized membrane protein YqhA